MTSSTRSTSTRAKPKTTRKSTARSTTPKVMATETTEPTPPQSDVVELPLPDADFPSLKKKELVDLAVARSGVKKRDAKPAIEAALAVLGEALAEGRELNLKPFGKLKVTRMKKGDNGQIINARVRQPEETENTAPDPLAQAAE